MGLGLKAAAAATVLFLSGTAADAAWAQTKAEPGSRSAISQTDGRWGLSDSKRPLQLNEKGRWGVTVDVDPPVGREAKLKDVEAGAFFRIAPSLKVGGAVDLGDKAVDRARGRAAPDERTTPRVKLETKFRF
jgi:hypothetical protein